MSKQSDPFGRRKSFHAAPPSAHSTQALRRLQALDAQRQRRTTAIEAARTAFRDLDDLEDLSLAGSSADEADSPPPPPLAASSSSEQQQRSQTDSHPEAAPVISKTKRKAFKPKYKAWAKNLLSYAETLDLRYGLPEGIDSDWRAVVVPKGKRCLCATASEQGGNNTILYSRVAGRALGRFYTSLPADCLLDTDSHLGVLWVLDVCKWRSQYLVQCEAEMRAFFIASKLSELPPQVYSPPSSSSETGSTPPGGGTARPLLVLPVPNLAPPLSPSVLLPLLAALNSTPPQTFDISALVVPVPVPDPSALSPSSVPTPPVPLTIPLHPTGLLLYLSQAHYESGSTPLVSWVPCADQIAEGMEQAEGVARMGQLVSEWQQVGTPRVTVVGAGGGAGSAGTRPDQVMLGGGQVSEVVMDG
ncbi:hypothetical protein B0A53_05994 [Rhodotorula sp. CCFEE 5036]|nr:hypothetical protein B0A53_05994 [Rhodotorula sp. CCFEE 5036]